MAEYAWVMKQWQRMCGSMQGGIAKCNNCPLLKVICQYKPDEKVRFAEAEKIITDWAAENPEPVYPTWGDWFAERGDLIKLWRHIEVCSGHGPGVIGILYEPIPADIAQKLGIEPKEG